VGYKKVTSLSFCSTGEVRKERIGDIGEEEVVEEEEEGY